MDRSFSARQQYYDVKNGTRQRLLDFYKKKDPKETHKDIFCVVEKIPVFNGFRLNQISAISACSGYGKNKSVFVLLKKENPYIIKANCNFHVTNNTVKDGLTTFTYVIEALVIKIYSEFGSSAPNGEEHVPETDHSLPECYLRFLPHILSLFETAIRRLEDSSFASFQLDIILRGLRNAGDTELFHSLESSLVEALPKEASEWRRSYGRAVKSVFVSASFIPFSKEILPKGGNWQLTHQPVFHIYWTECMDVDVYKMSVRDEIEAWLKTLNQHNIQDWMIVIVETYDLRKSNKLLPRTTVLDKIRSDFASKHADRCLSVINPVRSESRSAESWRGLVTRIRLLVLLAYNRTLLKFEEFIRDQRERRNELGWNFCHYFLLQEELAFVLEMLGVYDEALVQYDELDALFTQFVLNSNVGDTPAWLGTFQVPLEDWPGIVLDRNINQTHRGLIGECRASLLQFRGYLFTRQCTMLQLLSKPWELAQRCLPFLHNCVKELEILEVAAPPGAVACWLFLCSLEVLHTCGTFQEGRHVEACSLYTAGLWAYARDKLHELGALCGLLPGCDPSSQQLHTVVGLSAGMGDSREHGSYPTPTDKLKEALSSKEAFKKHYLELAELAMGTYKHIGRIRSARLVGRELAQFYLLLGERNKAAAFLSDSLKTYEEEGWRDLALRTQLELADCCDKMGDTERFVKLCAVIASAPELDMPTRISHFDKMTAALRDLSTDPPLTEPLSDCFSLGEVQVTMREGGTITKDSPVEVTLDLDSSLPCPIRGCRVDLSIEEVKTNVSTGVPAPRPQEAPAERRARRGQASQPPPSSVASTLPHRIIVDDPLRQANNPVLSRLSMVEHLDYQQDKSLSSASMASKNTKQYLRRSDSHGRYRKTSVAARSDFSYCLCKAREKGLYRLGQLSLRVAINLEFLSGTLTPRVGFEVTREPPSVTLNMGGKDLLAGLEQDMVLTVSSGSQRIEEGACLKLHASRGLSLQVQSSEESLCQEILVPLLQTEPFTTLSMQLRVMAELPPKRDSSVIEHKVMVQCPWLVEDRIIPLHFKPPFMSTCRLHTAQVRKFVQVVVAGLTTQMVELREPELSVMSDLDLPLMSLNPQHGQKQIAGNNMNVSFMWEVDVDAVQDTPPIKTEFSVKYSPINNVTTLSSEQLFTTYKCNFDVQDYKGSELCRSGTMCHLQLKVTRVNSGPHNSLMYEVLADQTMWAVCGRTAGVISLETVDKQNITLDVMPLIGGYLPLPGIRLSKYIPADHKSPGRDLSQTLASLWLIIHLYPPPLDMNRKIELSSHPRLEPFSPGQVYNSSKAQQVHVITSSTASQDTSQS
uniref:Trafficking protein particle complex subunit 10 n=1 Tax=Timema douglasi TaxID=61478 RepID=A0A7R8VKM1_TIMDO|nr:unnamed protein product [Timema douglasi]